MEQMDRLVGGVGSVCIAATALEYSLAFLTHAVEGWDDAKLAQVQSMPGRPLKEFEKVVPQLERVFGSNVSRLRADAERLLRERHRVVHSVMLLGTDAAGSARYEAWHPKSNATEPVEARGLYELAHDLAYAEMDVRGLTTALLAGPPNTDAVN